MSQNLGKYGIFAKSGILIIIRVTAPWYGIITDQQMRLSPIRLAMKKNCGLEMVQFVLQELRRSTTARALQMPSDGDQGCSSSAHRLAFQPCAYCHGMGPELKKLNMKLGQRSQMVTMN
jgi:hypothetical protein